MKTRKAIAIASLGLILPLTACTGLVAEGSSETSTSTAATATDETTIDETTTDETTTDTTSAGPASEAETANTDEVTAATEAFVTTLSADQLETLSFDYDDEDAKSNWSNLPEGMIQRNGLAMGDLTDEQKAAALAVVEAMLSEEGYEQVLQVMAADDVLAASSNGGAGGSNGGAGGLDWSSDNYFLAFFGDPTVDDTFLIQFGGHHLALNIDYSASGVTMTPEFVGIEPQTWTTDGTTYEPLGTLKESTFAILSALDEDQLATAELDMLYDDVVMGAGQDDATYPDDTGVLVSDLPAEQQDLVTAAIQEWVGDLDEDVAAEIMAQYVSQYDETYVMWSGSTDSEDADAYVRISGPQVWIELSNQAGIGTDEIHLHTVYRDKTSDYGTK